MVQNFATITVALQFSVLSHTRWGAEEDSPTTRLSALSLEKLAYLHFGQAKANIDGVFLLESGLVHMAT